MWSSYISTSCLHSNVFSNALHKDFVDVCMRTGQTNNSFPLGPHKVASCHPKDQDIFLRIIRISFRINEISSPDHFYKFFDLTSEHIFCSDRNTRSHKIPSDQKFWWIRRFFELWMGFRTYISGWLMYGVSQVCHMLLSVCENIFDRKKGMDTFIRKH